MDNLGSRKASNFNSFESEIFGARRLLSSSSVVVLVLSAGLTIPTVTMAADWTGVISNDWFVSGNWSPSAIPAAGDVVSIGTDTPNPTIVNGGNAIAKHLYVGNNSLSTGSLTILNGGTVSNGFGLIGPYGGTSGIVTVTGAGSSWSNSSDIAVGNFGAGTLNILNAAMVSSVGGYLGVGAAAVGTVTVDGPGSTWVNSGNLGVGHNGSGTLTISNGGMVSNVSGSVGTQSGSVGTVTVDGVGSIWANSGNLTIGDSGTGKLNIQNGAMVTNATGIVGNAVGSDGSATVSGIGSIWTNTGGLFVGQDGAGKLTISNGGVVSNASASVGNQTGATGAVTVDGVGSIWMNSGNLYLGGSGTGTLAISNGGTVSNDAGYLAFDPGSVGAVTISGTGSTWTSSGFLMVGHRGTGSLTVLNGGTVSNTDGYLGATAGSIGIGMVSGPGSTWSNNGDLHIGSLGTGTLTIANGGTVSAGGMVNIASFAGSNGTLNIGAAPGSSATGAGTLSATNIQFGLGTGTINFNHTDTNYIFAPAISGIGTLNQIAGNTILIADSSAFTGATNVTGGRLAVNGSLANSLVTVSNGGILGGNGIVGGIVANAGGIIAPGNSIGTLTVNGNIKQAAGSTYQVELTSTGQSDLIKASGTATIASGAALNVVKLDAAPYVLGTHYTVLEAGGGVSGTYTLTGNTALSAFIGLVAHYDPTHVYLDVQQTKSFAAAGQTPNQRATGAGAESLGLGNSLFNAIIMLPTDAAAQRAFDQLSGEVHASAKSVMVEDSRFVREAALDRLRDAFDTVGAARAPITTYVNGKPVAASATTDGFALWGRGFGAWGRSNGDGNAATVRRDISGFFMGADGIVGETWRVGLLGGYSRSTFNVKDRSSSGSSDNYHVGLYGGTTWGNLALRTGTAYTWHDISAGRSVVFPGFGDSLKGNYKAGTAQAFGELGYGINAGIARFEPFANLAYVSLNTKGLRETGGAAALSSGSSTTDATFTTLGLRASTSFDLNGAIVTAKGMIGWRHAFGNVTPLSQMRFAGGDAFTIGGVPIARNAAVIEAGLDYQITPAARLGVSYSGQFGSGLADQSLRANFNVKF